MLTTCVPICRFVVYYALRVLYRFECTYLCERCRKRRELSHSHTSGRVTWLSYVTRDKHWLSITSCHLPIKKACFTGFILLSLVWFVRLFSHFFFFHFLPQEFTPIVFNVSSLLIALPCFEFTFPFFFFFPYTNLNIFLLFLRNHTHKHYSRR